jgi:predicted  nucleic acid-binding Zn-ribbon protein
MNALDRLYAIQQKDTELQSLRQELEGLPAALGIEVSTTALEDAESELQSEQTELERLQSAQKAREAELANLGNKMKAEEDKLYGGTVANPKELRGLQAEVKILAKRRDEKETALLELMEEIEQLGSRIEGQERERDGKSAGLADARQREAQEQERIKARMEELEGEKAELRPEVPEDLLLTYEQLLKQKHNLAVVKVVEGICQGCRMEMPAQEYDRFLHGEGVFKCPTCGRILVR